MGYLCMHYTIQPLYQGTGNTGKESLSEVDRKVAGSITRDDLTFYVFNHAIMYEICTYAYSELVACNSHCNSGC